MIENGLVGCGIDGGFVNCCRIAVVVVLLRSAVKLRRRKRVCGEREIEQRRSAADR